MESSINLPLVSLRDSLKQHLPTPAWHALRAGKREAKALLFVARRTRSALTDAPVPAKWTWEAVQTQVRLARSHSDGPCRVRIAGFEVASLSADQLAFLHQEIFVELAYYFRTARPDPLIVDGGSNIGVSVIFFKTLYPDARVLAFEPAERAYELLSRNAGALPGVELHRVALGRENAVVSFYGEQDDPTWLRQSTRPERPSAPRQTRVEQRRLSEFLDGEVDLLKLDIEGAEEEVVGELAESGAMERVQQLIVEYHHQLDPDRDSIGAFLERLRALGFHYQLSARERIKDRDTLKPRFQDVLVHAYRRQPHAPPLRTWT